MGREVDIDHVMRSVLEDRMYYRNSNGGVTCTGGECMLQIDFLKELLVECKNNEIHTAVDTAGCVHWERFERILDAADLFLYDIKAVDDALHRKLTGTGNRLILKNLERLSRTGTELIVRVPFVPGANDGEISRIGEFLKELNINSVELLPYHRLGEGKRKALGIVRPGSDFPEPAGTELDDAIKTLKNLGLDACRT